MALECVLAFMPMPPSGDTRHSNLTYVYSCVIQPWVSVSYICMLEQMWLASIIFSIYINWLVSFKVVTMINKNEKSKKKPNSLCAMRWVIIVYFCILQVHAGNLFLENLILISASSSEYLYTLRKVFNIFKGSICSILCLFLNSSVTYVYLCLLSICAGCFCMYFVYCTFFQSFIHFPFPEWEPHQDVMAGGMYIIHTCIRK